MSPGEAVTSEGVNASDLLIVGEPTTMVIILEKGARGEGGVDVEDGLEAAMEVEVGVLLAGFAGRPFPFLASIPLAFSSDRGLDVSKIYYVVRKEHSVMARVQDMIKKGQTYPLMSIWPRKNDKDWTPMQRRGIIW